MNKAVQFLDEILTLLNGKVIALFPCDRKNVLGLAQSVRVSGNNAKPKIVPAVYSGQGVDVTYAGFEDHFDLCSYHKAATMTSTRVPGGYGDEEGRIVLLHNMQLVLCADMAVLQQSAQQMALTLQFGFPDSLKPPQFPSRGFYSIRFNINSVSLNPEQIFREEFQNVDFFLGPNHALLKVNYVIESTMNKKCFSQLCEPSKTFA